MKRQGPEREKGGLFHRAASKMNQLPFHALRPEIARPGQAQEGSASENSALVGLGSEEWLGSCAVRRSDVEICGSVEEPPLLPPLRHKGLIVQRAKVLRLFLFGTQRFCFLLFY